MRKTFANILLMVTMALALALPSALSFAGEAYAASYGVYGDSSSNPSTIYNPVGDDDDDNAEKDDGKGGVTGGNYYVLGLMPEGGSGHVGKSLFDLIMSQIKQVTFMFLVPLVFIVNVWKQSYLAVFGLIAGIDPLDMADGHVVTRQTHTSNGKTAYGRRPLFMSMTQEKQILVIAALKSNVGRVFFSLIMSLMMGVIVTAVIDFVVYVVHVLSGVM